MLASNSESTELWFLYGFNAVVFAIIIWDIIRIVLHSLFKIVLARVLHVGEMRDTTEFFGSISEILQSDHQDVKRRYLLADQEFIYYLSNSDRIISELKESPNAIVGRLRDIARFSGNKEKQMKFLLHWRHTRIVRGDRYYILDSSKMNFFQKAFFAVFGRKYRKYVEGKSQRFLKLVDYIIDFAKENRDLRGNESLVTAN